MQVVDFFNGCIYDCLTGTPNPAAPFLPIHHSGELQFHIRTFASYKLYIFSGNLQSVNQLAPFIGESRCYQDKRFLPIFKIETQVVAAHINKLIKFLI